MSLSIMLFLPNVGLVTDNDLSANWRVRIEIYVKNGDDLKKIILEDENFIRCHSFAPFGDYFDEIL